MWSMCGLVYTYMRTNQCNQYVRNASVYMRTNQCNQYVPSIHNNKKATQPEMQAYICVPITVINMCQVYTRIALPVDEYAIDVSQVHKRVHVCLQPCDWIKYKMDTIADMCATVCICMYMYVYNLVIG